ncbi:MAG: FtsX-like permease family protein [Bacteriovorax sp.]|jgi:putative ABC transport system permease protein
MSFLKFFWRDFKSDQAYNWFTILCASLGIIGLLLVESFKVGVEDKVTKNARNFIASDLSISTRRGFEADQKTKIENYLSAKQLSYARWIETYSLVSRSDSENPLAKLADLNFVSPEFPFYGGVVLEGEGFFGAGKWNRIHQAPKAWISRDLSWELSVRQGDSIKIGEISFVIDGIINEDKFSSFRGFNLAPKVFLSSNFLDRTDLIKFGSTATYTYAIKLRTDESLETTQKDFRTMLPDRTVKITGPEESSQQISRSLRLLADYLSLITLMTYLLSLIGLYYFTQHFLSKKIKIFSIYKAMGIKNSFLFKVNFAHLIVLTTASVLISTSLIVFILPLLEDFFSKLIGETLFFRLNGLSLLRILALSLFGSLCALGPLFWGALQTPVAIIFQDLPAELKRIKFYYFIPLMLYIILLAVLLANSIKVGSIFLLALASIIMLGAVCFKVFTILCEKISIRLQFINRHALRSLTRYFTSSFTIFICLLMGMTLTIFIFQLERSIRQEFSPTTGTLKPDLFMFDIQDSQIQQFSALVESEKWQQTMLAPMVRGRLLRINNAETTKRQEPGEANFSTREDESSQGIKNRGVNLSYRSKLSWSENIVDGTWNGKRCNPDAGPCEISLDKGYAKRLGVELDDKLVFDISGIEITGIVRSFRSVKWTSFEPNFFILFQPGILEDAPKTYLASFKVRSLEEKRAIFSKIAQKFPNVSVLEVSEILKKVTAIFDLMALAIKFIANLSLFVALVVLIAVSFNHLDLKKREMTLYTMLGLRQEKIKKIVNREFSTLLLLCIFLSLLFGSLMTIAMMKFLFDSGPILRLPFVVSIMAGIGIVLFTIVSLRVRYLIKRKSLF